MDELVFHGDDTPQLLIRPLPDEDRNHDFRRYIREISHHTESIGPCTGGVVRILQTDSMDHAVPGP